jgi:hypothetical protein
VSRHGLRQPLLRTTMPGPQSPSTPRPTLPPSLLALPPFSTTSRTRLQALYSDISRQRHSSPESYHANVEWWRRAIENLVGSGTQGFGGGKGKEKEGERTANKLVLRAGRELVDSLKVEGVGKPLGLGAVVVSRDKISPLVYQATDWATAPARPIFGAHMVLFLFLSSSLPRNRCMILDG